MKFIKIKEEYNDADFLKTTNEEMKITKDSIMEYNKKFFLIKKRTYKQNIHICKQCDLRKKYNKCLRGCTKLIDEDFMLKEIDYYKILFGEK